ncbi:MAG: nuclear transport factor 2 family protein [Gammaproteobacteria bacterium]|nr:nuclear transport factor 2 family protein [Gammaproteobacteria bacterium]
MADYQWIKQLFAAIDNRDAKAFVKYISAAGTFRFGNMPPVAGRENIEKFVAGFFQSIEAVSHELIDIWEVPEGRVCHGLVSYTRKNGTMLTVPFANVLKGEQKNITEYLIFADTSGLYDQ